MIPCLHGGIELIPAESIVRPAGGKDVRPFYPPLSGLQPPSGKASV